MAVAENVVPNNDLAGQSLVSGNNDPDRSSTKSRSDSAAVNGDQVEKEKDNESLVANGFDSVQVEIRRLDDGVLADDEVDYDDDEADGDDDRLEAVGCDGDDDRYGVHDIKKIDHNDLKNRREQEMNELMKMLSKLNPMAEEFVPQTNGVELLGNGFAYPNNFAIQVNQGIANGQSNRRKKNSSTQGRRRMNNRTTVAQRDEMIRRTVYVSDVDNQVTEEQLALLFSSCGQVVDCRVCGDTNSALRFAFIEFTDEESAKAALSLSGTLLGFYPLRVLPSKTAIAPVNPTFLPRSEDEREMCARTIYCTNIDKKITQADVRLFFETFCGKVQRLRILGDYHHSTRIAFIEFAMAESAIVALGFSGAILGSSAIRVSPSKTPVRPRSPRFPLH